MHEIEMKSHWILYGRRKRYTERVGEKDEMLPAGIRDRSRVPFSNSASEKRF